MNRQTEANIFISLSPFTSLMRAMVLWECVLYLLCSLVTSQSERFEGGNCRSNTILNKFEFTYPTKGLVVPQIVFVDFVGDFFDTNYIVENNALYSICVTVNGQELRCTEQLFDNFEISLDGVGRHEISGALCPNNSKDCLCNVTTWVECCAPPPLKEVGAAGKLHERTRKAIAKMEVELQHSTVTQWSPWSCR